MNIRKITSSVLILAMIVFMSGVLGLRTASATLTTYSDALSRLKTGQAANHEILFATSLGIAASATVTLTFSSDFTGVSALGAEDFDVATGSTGTCSTASYTEQNVQASAGASNWGAAASGNVVTITGKTSGTPLATNKCLRIRIGTNATDTTGSGPGDSQITNGAADDDDTIVLGGSFTESGTAAVDIISDDQVVITATVDPTITFTISDNTVGFGTLSTTTTHYAAGDSVTGITTSSTIAHTLEVATNASSGYTLTYSGTTLTGTPSGTITAASSIATGGTPGQSQYAMSAQSQSGTATITSNYVYGTPLWSFVGSNTTTTLATNSSPTDDVLNMRYEANIAGTTPAGTYTGTNTFIATGNF